jgi:WD40 repeat protein
MAELYLNVVKPVPIAQTSTTKLSLFRYFTLVSKMTSPLTVTSLQVDYVLPLVVSNNSIIAGSQNGLISRIGVDGRLIYTLEADLIWCLACSGDTIVTGGQDGTIKIWNAVDG